LASGWVDALTERGRQVLAIDLPGHGPGEQPHDPQAYASLADRVYRRLPADGVFDVIGYSLGAKLTLAMAVQTPARFNRLVIGGLGGNVFAPERSGDAVATALEEGFEDSTPLPIRRLVDYALSAGNDALAMAAVSRRPPNPVITASALMQLPHPILVIAGDQDSMAQPLEPLTNVLPHAHGQVLTGVDHLALPANADFKAAALAFID